VALVTGGAVRLGRAIAVRLARQGMRLAIAYYGSERQAQEMIRAMRARGIDAAAFRADLRSATEARRLVRDTIRRFGRLDVLVNNAAVFERTPFLDTTPAQYDAHLALNLRGAFFCAQAAARRMTRGWIVNIGDGGVDRVWPGYVPYTLSKIGVHALTRALAVALAPRIAVNCVAPGPVLRPPGFPLGAWQKIRAPGGSAAVASAVAFLATCPRTITGRIVVVGRGRVRAGGGGGRGGQPPPSPASRGPGPTTARNSPRDG
jgi:NAD(P)-dependent dehydrogenase (short-subunit alcohol dehydrogenase family)